MPAIDALRRIVIYACLCMVAACGCASAAEIDAAAPAQSPPASPAPHAAPALRDGAPTPAIAESPRGDNCAADSKLDDVIVTEAYNWKNRTNRSPHVQLRDEIGVKVENLSALIAAAQCAKPAKRILLFLDGRPITNVSPDPPTDPTQKELIFPLRRDDRSREAWTAILGQPGFKARAVSVSVGFEGEYAVRSTSTASLSLEIIPWGWFLTWCAVLIALIYAFLKLERGEMLRISGMKPALPAKKAFSLSRVQLAWWTFITLAAYLFIGLITGDYNSTITPSVLVLIGISAGTTAVSVVIDKNDETKAAAQGQVPAVDKSEGLWTDIVSDANGVSFHRYQMAVWTVVLGIVFWITVYRELAMPAFNDTLLGLMGISAGTYLGVKTAEAKP